MSTVAKCDIIRAGAAATMQAGVCGGSSPPADCYVTDLAAKRDMYIQTKYSPTGLVSGTALDIRSKELSILEADINADIARIQAKYGSDAPANISWNDFTHCLWNPDGSRGGPHKNVYFGRDDLTSLGYQPQPIFGATTLEGRLPTSLTNSIPVWVDHIFNPDLAAVFIFAILVILFAVLIYKAYKRAHPPDPEARWKNLVSVYEAQGYDMCEYRKKLGMPLKDKC